MDSDPGMDCIAPFQKKTKDTKEVSSPSSSLWSLRSSVKLDNHNLQRQALKWHGWIVVLVIVLGATITHLVLWLVLDPLYTDAYAKHFSEFSNATEVFQDIAADVIPVISSISQSFGAFKETQHAANRFTGYVPDDALVVTPVQFSVKSLI